MSPVGMTLGAIVWAGIAVLVAISAAQLLVVISGGRALAAATRRHSSVEDDAAMASPLTPPVSLILPWYEGDALERLHAVQGLRYPDIEIIVVSSNAAEMARLRASHGLVEIPVVLPVDMPSRVEVTSAAIPRDGSGLIAVEVRGPANSADLLNVGAGLARNRLVCVVHPGVALADDTLLRLARPFRDRPRDTLAATTIARPVETGVLRHHQVVGRRWPGGWDDRFRFVSELESAVLRHAADVENRALSQAGGLLLIRRDQAQEVGGFRPRLGSEDDDLRVRTTRMQRSSARRTRRVTPVAAPVCWRAGDDDGRDTPNAPGRRFRIGGPIFLGTLAVAALAGLLGLGLGLLEWPLLGLLVVAGGLLPATISLAAVAVDDLAFPKDGSSADLLATVGAALVEPFGLGRALEQ